MKQIQLQKDHRDGDKHFKAGESIEVDDATYDYLMSTYMGERKDAVAREAEAKKRLDKLLTTEKEVKNDK